MKLLAKTHYGLEQVLADELKDLGATGVSVLNRAVAFEGSKLLLYTWPCLFFCQFLRLASQVRKTFTTEQSRLSGIGTLTPAKHLR